MKNKKILYWYTKDVYQKRVEMRKYYEKQKT